MMIVSLMKRSTGRFTREGSSHSILQLLSHRLLVIFFLLLLLLLLQAVPSNSKAPDELSARVALLNQQFAKTFGPREDPNPSLNRLDPLSSIFQSRQRPTTPSLSKTLQYTVHSPLPS